MSEWNKVTDEHLRRRAVVYIRQSSPAQVLDHKESTERQYHLAERAIEMGWKPDQVDILDQDQGVSSDGIAERKGFSQLTSMVGLGQVGIVFGLEVSRLARNSVDWYRLLELCSITNTLIGDIDSVYHPALFNDRLVLGLRGTMSEAELHVMRTRLQGGARNKASKGELRTKVPIGYIWRPFDSKPILEPNESVTDAIRAIFHCFSEKGSIRQVWMCLRAEGLKFPQRISGSQQYRWVNPSYMVFREVLTNSFYAGAYGYGKTRRERYVDEQGRVQRRIRKLPRSKWAVMIVDHHEGYIDWETYESNQQRIEGNNRPQAGEHGGAVREGSALLQGLGRCGHCGRGLRVQYSGRNNAPYYICANDQIIAGRGVHCLWVSGHQIHEAVVSAFLSAVQPAGIEASLKAVELAKQEYEQTLKQWHNQVERARYEASLAERRYQAVDPENRLVARGLEAQWEQKLKELQEAQAEFQRRQRSHPQQLSQAQKSRLLKLGKDIKRVWSAPSTTDRDRKELLRTLLEEVMIKIPKPGKTAYLTLRWRGGLITDLNIELSHRRSYNRTKEDTVALIRRLSKHYPDPAIAGILNRQGRTTQRGLGFTPSRVRALRGNWNIPCYKAPAKPVQGEVVGITKAAEILKLDRSTLHRWLSEGIIPGEQITAGAPWKIRITEKLLERFQEQAPEGYVSMLDAMRILGVSRQTVLNRVKRGELDSVHVRRGRRKGLLIRVSDRQTGLFDRRGKARG